MFEVGRLCLKIAGRDAGKKCVVVDILEKNFVLIDGETRRRKCNISHLEPLKEVIKLAEKASHDEVKKALETLGFQVRDSKPKKATQKPKVKPRRVKKPQEKTEKPKTVKKEKPQVKAAE